MFGNLYNFKIFRTIMLMQEILQYEKIAVVKTKNGMF